MVAVRLVARWSQFGSWRRQSKPVRLELYTRWTFHPFGIGEAGAVMATARRLTLGPAGGGLVALISPRR